MKTAHIFAGSGGGLLADLILGHTPIEAVEWDVQSCENLHARSDWFPELQVHCADIRGFDASSWKGRVDILHAGIPCPKWSTARRGQGETYDGWSDTFRIIQQAHPPIVFLECVEAFKREHERVRRDLDQAGYGISKPLVSDVASLGAPHSRRRYWAIGYSYNKGQSMCNFNAEMAILQAFDAGPWWENPPLPLGVDDGMAHRVYRFRATGNGQIPVQAAAAFLMLGGPLDMSAKEERRCGVR